MLASYHNHTVWSDGKGTVAEMVESARALGLEEVGISDHLMLPADGSSPPCGIARDRIDDYFAALDEVARQSREPGAPGPLVRVGVEVDWYPDSHDRLAAALDGRPVDVVIGSVHEVDGFPLDASPAPWDRLDESDRNAMHRGYWRLTADMARSRLFDIAAHLDLPRKYGHYATIDLTDEIEATLDAIAESNMVVELNTAGWHKPCRDAYPGVDILSRCRARNIPVTLSADAHDPAHLVRDFDRGAERLREAGYDSIMRFDRRARRACALPAAGGE